VVHGVWGWIKFAAVTTALALTAGCATPPSADDEEALAAYKEANDPLEPFNRSVLEFNRSLDRAVLRPVAETYRTVVPGGVRDGVRNVLNNIRTPNILVNDLLQGEGRRASESARRLTLNTLTGAGGVIDVMGMDPGDGSEPVRYHGEDFGQTLAVWGVSEGPYLMLPLVGPASPRAVAGKVGDIFLDPVSYVIPSGQRFYFSLSRFLATGVDRRSRTIEAIDEIERTSIDFYVTVRSLYRQQRRAAIMNGDAGDTPAPDLSIDFEDDDEQELKALKTVRRN
jgi:phospholipid-binding lipoprotein MlaA